MNRGFILDRGPPSFLFSHYLSRVQRFWNLTCNGYALQTGEIIINSKLIAHFFLEKFMWVHMTWHSYIAEERAFLYDKSCSKYWTNFLGIYSMWEKHPSFCRSPTRLLDDWSEYWDVINKAGTLVRVKMTTNICRTALYTIHENLRITEIWSLN
jgi:hypothetical protein